MTAADYPVSITASFGATNAPQVIAHYPLSDYESPSLALAAAQTDQLMACPARRLDRLLRQCVPTYGYEFDDWNAPFFFPAASFPYGAAHTLEIQYLFPLYHGGEGVPKPLNASQEQLSQDMVSYWTGFAASGNPNSGTAPAWPRYSAQPGEDPVAPPDDAGSDHGGGIRRRSQM